MVVEPVEPILNEVTIRCIIIAIGILLLAIFILWIKSKIDDLFNL